ncbi:hypothetical protein F2Q65_02505 [Thiohalocapsa marina]|uniref:Glycosyltransferase family 2 protein n=1 Tax=Thiohalocapsa marina TaxID=424902 RepID=A0A5M8FUF9_9GAMM|nr:hypothetical protein [Thiohalocapsa marina]KAA6187413.1 hypothetical protein F2Q65_02505 [Thiohalocapsa marina]
MDLKRRRPDKVNLVLAPGMGKDIIRNIAKFWQFAVEENTIYIRFDDDIAWIHPDAVERLCETRLSHPEFWLISGNVINNAVCDHHLQVAGIYDTRYTFSDSAECPQGWKDPEAAEWKHRSFLSALSEHDVDSWQLPDYQLDLGKHFSINCLCWLGDDLRDFEFFDEERFLVYEEPFMTKEMTHRIGRPVLVAGKALVAHFAFYTQRKHLDSTDLLERYRSIAEVQ